MPHLKTTLVEHVFTRIETGKDGYSIGAYIDQHLFEMVNKGKLVSEVSLFFETEIEQRDVSAYYQTKPEMTQTKAKKAY